MNELNKAQYEAVTTTEGYPMDMLQVVGHTHVVEPTREGNLLTVDTFFTYRDGDPIGDETFVVVDTETMEYETIYQW